MDESVAINRETITLVERVMQAVRQRIAGRTLMPGAKLPSIRSFAETMGVSKSTIVEAYDRLAAEGVIQSRRGSGFYVAGHLPPLSLAEIGPRLDLAIDPLWVSRTSLEASEAVAIPVAAGYLPHGCRKTAFEGPARIGAGKSSSLADYAPPLGIIATATSFASHGGTWH